MAAILVLFSKTFAMQTVTRRTYILLSAAFIRNISGKCFSISNIHVLYEPKKDAKKIDNKKLAHAFTQKKIFAIIFLCIYLLKFLLSPKFLLGFV